MSTELKGVTPLFSTASLKSKVRMYVNGPVSVSKKESAEDCEFGLTPGGWALLSGDFKVPDFGASSCSSASKAEKTEKTPDKQIKYSTSAPGFAKPGLIKGKFVLGSNEDATVENPELVKEMKLEHKIPEWAYGNINVRTANDKKGLYSGGKDHKGRELVYIYDIKFVDPSTVRLGAKKRLYPHQIEKLGYGWKTELTITYTIRIPKDHIPTDSEDDDEGGLGLGSDSDSDSSS